MISGLMTDKSRRNFIKTLAAAGAAASAGPAFAAAAGGDVLTKQMIVDAVDRARRSSLGEATWFRYIKGSEVINGSVAFLRDHDHDQDDSTKLFKLDFDGGVVRIHEEYS